MPQYFAIRIGDDPEIKRSWTEVYDALATVALERAEAAQADRLPEDERARLEIAAEPIAGSWVDALNAEPVESGLYWVITGPLAGGGKLYWWNAEEHQWEHPAAKCSLTVNAKAWMPCPELPEGLRWNREELG